MEEEAGAERRAQKATPNSSWAALHILTLLLMSACHNSVQFYFLRTGGMEHMFKYVCEDPDRVTVQIILDEERYDEIGHSQDAL